MTGLAGDVDIVERALAVLDAECRIWAERRRAVGVPARTDNAGEPDEPPVRDAR